MSANGAKPQLELVWKQLEKLSVDLWSDNSPRAVVAQALLEEYRGEMVRFDTQSVNVEANLAQAARLHAESLESLRSDYAAEMAGLKKRLELLERQVKDKDAEIVLLLDSIADHEKRNMEFHAQVLKMAAANDESSAKQMEELYRALKLKEEFLAVSWGKREVALNEDAQMQRGILAARQAELEAWEKRRLLEEDALKRADGDLEVKSKQLQQEYRLKQKEIETLKTSLQQSVTELVRQYQSRLKNEASASTGL